MNASGMDLALFLKERNPTTIDAMADLAERYVEARGGAFGQDRQTYPSSNRVERTMQRPSTGNSTTHRPVGTDKQLDKKPWVHKPGSQPSYDPRYPRLCYICHKPGHLARNCRNTFVPTKVAGLIEEHPETMSPRRSNCEGQNLAAATSLTSVCTECHHAISSQPNTTPPDVERVACMYTVKKGKSC